MEMTRTRGLALLLIACGGFVMLHKLGLMEYVIPAALVGLGYVGIRNDKKIGWLLAIVGLSALAAHLSGLLAIVFAVVLIACGVSMYKKRAYSHKDFM